MGLPDAALSLRDLPDAGAQLSAATIATLVTAAIIVATIAFALIGSHRLRVTPAEYMIGGRSFGSLFLWLLMAGEIYTTFTFLGAAGWAYGKGAPAYYILAYGTVGYVVGYFLLPAIWRRGNAGGLLTAADFFYDRYGKRALSAAVAVIYFFIIIPYVTLQLGGMQILLQIAGYGSYDARIAVIVAFAIIALFVFTAGLRGTAWASVVKDTLVLGGVVFAGVVLPVHFFGSPAAVFDRIAAANPAWLTLQPGAYSPLWYVTTVTITGIGFFMGSHNIAAVFSAKSEDAVRRNAIFLPFYQLLLVLMFFAGFTALLVVPGLKGAAGDQSFMLVVQRYYPPWVLGIIAGAGCLAGLVPASAQLLAAASVLSKNFFGDLFGIATHDEARTKLTRILVLVIAVLALVFWTAVRKETIVGLLLLYYNGIIQMLPAFVFGVAWPRVGAAAVGAGLVAGFASVLALIALAGTAPTIGGINPGIISLGVNAAVCVLVALTKKPAV